MIRILIVETVGLIREGLVALLTHEPDLAVVGACGEGDEIVPMAVEIKPDVALIDVDFPTMDAFTVAQTLRAELPKCAVVLTAAHRRPGDLQRAAAAQVAGLMVKDNSSDVLASAIRRVARGERVVDADLVFSTLEGSGSPLTPRELDVLRLVAEGVSTDQIAEKLVITVGTVRNYLSRVNSKIGAHNRVQAVRIAEAGQWL